MECKLAQDAPISEKAAAQIESLADESPLVTLSDLSLLFGQGFHLQL